MRYFELERVVIEKYINELSGNAFKALLKIIYLAQNSNEITARKIQQKTFGVSSFNYGDIYDELVRYGLLIKKEKSNRIVYILNSKKIRQDNIENTDKDDLNSIKITIFKTNKIVEISENVILNNIKKILVLNDCVITDNLLKVIKFAQKYNIEKERKFHLAIVTNFLIEISKFNFQSINDTCLKFNEACRTSPKNFSYFMAIIKDILIDDKSDEINQSVIDETNKRKIEGELKFAARLAKGHNILNNAIYLKLLNKQNFDELNRLWSIGVKKLDEKDICYNYDWLIEKETMDESEEQIS